MYNYNTLTSYNSKNHNQQVTKLKTFHFSSSLKRMSSVVKVQGFSEFKDCLVVCKGANETIGDLLKNKPANYDETAQSLANQGYRILSLAYKRTEKVNIKREEAEKDLIFAGFLVLENHLKSDTKKYIKRIEQSGRRIVILTGDHLLTSISTFKSLEINHNKTLILTVKNNTIRIKDL